MKLPSVVYLILYVSLIPIFGVIYNNLPFEFYHSTNKYEKYIDVDKKVIITDLQTFLKVVLLQAHGKRIIVEGGRYFDINTIKILDITFVNEEAQIYVIGYAFGKDQSMSMCYESHLNFSLSSFSPPDTLENGELVIHQLICTQQDNPNFLLKAYDVFTSGKLKIRWGESGVEVWPGHDCGFIFIPISIMNKITAYYSALKGFPSYSSGNFERMLYLSAMIITTVGLGDIVPISTRARFFVTLEAILGIIIIGLFLNSLAKKIIGK